MVEGPKPADADLELLHRLLEAYSDVLADAVERVQGSLGIAPASRIKNMETILDKLRRNRGHGLKSIQDLIGMRIDETGADAMRARFAAEGEFAGRPEIEIVVLGRSPRKICA